MLSSTEHAQKSENLCWPPDSAIRSLLETVFLRTSVPCNSCVLRGPVLAISQEEHEEERTRNCLSNFLKILRKATKLMSRYLPPPPVVRQEGDKTASGTV